MKVIMYHYVRPDSDEFPYFNHLPVSVFKKQLKFFQKHYGLISKDQFLEFLETGNPCEGVLLTFDDGLRDHYEFVLPELDTINAWGLFFASTGVYNTKKLLGVHRIHMLKGKYGANQILSRLEDILNPDHLDYSLINEFDKEIYKEQAGGHEEYKLKRLLNYFISYDYRDTYLNSLMRDFFDEEDLFAKTYLIDSEINEINSAGSIVGSHTVSHPVLSRLSFEQQNREIEDSFRHLEQITGKADRFFCYPYGYRSSYDDNTLKVLKKNDVKCSFVFDNKEVGPSPKLQEISRLDCNQFMDI